MIKQQIINNFSERLKSSDGILFHEIKVYNLTTQKKIKKFAKDGSLDFDKLAFLILKKKGEIDPNV